jgi:hypothetical protein
MSQLCWLACKAAAPRNLRTLSAAKGQGATRVVRVVVNVASHSARLMVAGAWPSTPAYTLEDFRTPQGARVWLACVALDRDSVCDVYRRPNGVANGVPGCCKQRLSRLCPGD